MGFFMQWTAETIRTLRLSLGWSQADFSRRLGCNIQNVIEWERGTLSPTMVDCRQLERLVHYLDAYADVIARQSLSEPLLTSLNVEQIHRNDLIHKNN